MFKSTAFALCLALAPIAPSCGLLTEDVRVEQVTMRADTFLPIARDVCQYVHTQSPDPALADLLDLLSDPEREIRVARLAPLVDWVLPLYVMMIDSDPTLSLNAKEGRKLAARALETSLNRILER